MTAKKEKIVLSKTQIARANMLKRQHSICILCGEFIQHGDDVLDHDHETGRIRGVLHRACNTFEGSVLAAFMYMGRKAKTMDQRRELLKKLDFYLSMNHDKNPMHPTHVFPERKEIRRLEKKLKGPKALKTPKGIARAKAKIKVLEAKIKVLRDS